jgi:indolepyruvate ferredoxin oxidoreductase alpha subunit
MGAAISQAAGFYHAYKHEAKRPDIVATIGDSTFFHAGLPALVDAVNQKARFVLVILDNRTTAMTGNQPTPATGLGAGGDVIQAVDIEAAVKGCGVSYIREANPYDTDELIAMLKAAVAYSRETGPAVVISRYPCVIDKRYADQRSDGGVPIVTDDCDGCGYCVQQFECPAIHLDDDASRALIDEVLCSGCGVCVHVCPKESIQPGSRP